MSEQNPNPNPFDALLEAFRKVVREEIATFLAPNQLYTPEELAEKLKLPVSWVYEQSRKDAIPTHRLGRYIRFDLQEVLRSRAYREKEDDAA